MGEESGISLVAARMVVAHRQWILSSFHQLVEHLRQHLRVQS